MLYIKNNANNPYFNTAAEEYILENFENFHDDNIFMLWQNEPCVYLGANQNAYAEINLDYAAENNIKIVRRLSGGGCVYHDMGNINFSFFTDLSNININDNDINDIPGVSNSPNSPNLRKSQESQNEFILNFEYYTKPIINALQNLGIRAELTGRNDLTVSGVKFSGNAQCVYTPKKNKHGGKKLLHHGTILFDADMQKLSRVLNADEEKIKGRNVKSIKSRVTNLIDCLPENQKISAGEFKNYIENYFISENQNNCKIYYFSREDIKNIQCLADNYYYTDSFIYGSNLQYSFRNKKRFDFGTLEVCFNVRDSKIKDAKIYGDFFCGPKGANGIKELENCLNGLSHDVNSIKKGLCNYLDMSHTCVNEFIKGCDICKFLELFI